ncbi:hypothetical protein J3Q64DRAFT_1762230 [Phycomyces blakesleeanus]|uniref:Uncharacterized protein n=1 Tax=Phycomyces blakesleeanus TaxID=4837 RepID=A0ABR3AQR7_PHYBL
MQVVLYKMQSILFFFSFSFPFEIMLPVELASLRTVACSFTYLGEKIRKITFFYFSFLLSFFPYYSHFTYGICIKKNFISV